ncbi:MAG: helix-turn-helix domain-containing protein [Verrucomicrobiaceae bacterium]|nr:MAG: helix-turn-helix domain-containing protein [Verrucomicrobiaceae bacterium]
MFVHSAVDDAGLSLKAFRVLGHLHRRAGKSEYAWPGVETMADATGLNGKTVKRALKELVAAGFIIREPRKGTSTAYRLVKTPVETGQHDAGETGKRRGPEIGLGQKVTQPKEGPRDGAKNGPGVAQKMAHKDNPIKETKEEDSVFISLNACGVVASTADEAPAPLSPTPPPDPPGI